MKHEHERSKPSHLPLLIEKSFQVHRALKHAVNAGLLRHRSGRYKAVFTLNPAPIKQPVNENNEQKSADGMNTFDKQQTSSKSQSSDKKENRLMLYLLITMFYDILYFTSSRDKFSIFSPFSKY